MVRIVRETIPRLGNLGGSVQAYSVMATATDYLPEAIGGYLRLPRQWADSRPVDRGKTSLMILIDQLDLLGATMDKVFDAVNRADAAALIAHGRFLQEKFGTGSTGGSLGTRPDRSRHRRPTRDRRDHCNHHQDEEGHERRGGNFAAGRAVRPAVGRRACRCRGRSSPGGGAVAGRGTGRVGTRRARRLGAR